MPFAPQQPIIYREEDNRPQTRLDRDTDKEKRKVAEDICNFDPCGFGRERSTDKKVCKFSAGWCEVKR